MSPLGQSSSRPGDSSADPTDGIPHRTADGSWMILPYRFPNPADDSSSIGLTAVDYTLSEQPPPAHYLDHHPSHTTLTDVGGEGDNDKLPSPHPPYAEAGHTRSGSATFTDGESSVDDTDDFDWDTSDGDDDEEGANKDPAAMRAKRLRRVYMGCMRLARPVRIFVIGLLGTAIALIPFIVVLAAFKNNSARAEVEVWSIWIAIIWASSCGTFLVVDWIPPLAIRLAITVYGKAPEIFKTYIELFMATTVYTKLVLCISWGWISLGGVLAIEYTSGTNSPDPRPSYWVWVFRVIQALFGTSIILLVEKVALQLVAINFHKTAMKDRLENNQRALRALDKLHEAKYVVQKQREKERARGSTAWGRSFGFGSRPGTPGGINGSSQGHGAKPSRDGLGGYFPPAGQSEPEKQQQPYHRHRGSQHQAVPQTDATDGELQTHSERKAYRKANFAAQLQDALAAATMKGSKLYKSQQLGSQQSARKLAKKLFTNLAYHKKTLVADDFIPYFKTEAEAREAFSFFDADRNGDISKNEMREAVQRIYRERRALSTSLKDMSSAISKLDLVLMSIGLIIVVFIWLLIFNRNATVANIVPLSTFVVGFSFVFGNSAKTIFESMIFIFATHPYDVGDLVFIDDVPMFVKEFGMISTVFRTTTNQEVVAPNAMLASSKYIHNSRRSGNQWETTDIKMSFDTALETMDEFRKRLRAWVAEHDREWGGGLDVNFSSIDQMNCVTLTIAMEHKGNWQEWGTRWARRTQLMRQVKTIAEDLGMEYSLPPQPITFQPRSGPAPFGAGNGRMQLNPNSSSPRSPRGAAPGLQPGRPNLSLRMPAAARRARGHDAGEG